MNLIHITNQFTKITVCACSFIIKTELIVPIHDVLPENTSKEFSNKIFIIE